MEIIMAGYKFLITFDTYFRLMRNKKAFPICIITTLPHGIFRVFFICFFYEIFFNGSDHCLEIKFCVFHCIVDVYFVNVHHL